MDEKLRAELQERIVEKAKAVVAGERTTEALVDYVERLYARHEERLAPGLAEILARGACGAVRAKQEGE